MQMMSVGTVITRVMLDQREREDYALLNEEQIVYIFFVINALKKNCILFYFSLFKFFFLIFLFGVGSLNVECPGLGDLLWLFSCGW